MLWVNPYTRIRFGRLEHVRGHYGHHHHIAGTYLLRYAAEEE